jgi:A/G-specific adenine glycosylase
MPAKPAPFADRLLAWWDRHGRNNLPWQHPRTPYRVWISEIMLQQTQVSTVIPYFERWMESFPDIASLAAASQDEILAHWSGLGYYARARNIHKAASICREQHHGQLPVTSGELITLPGIGQSTANAIVSQATDRPAAVLDGNVRRVLARHTATEGWTGNAAVQKALWVEAEKRLPDRRGADYTQAVMDLGALLCTRGKPQCASCPVREDCRARIEGRTPELPSPKPPTKISNQSIVMPIVRDDSGRVLLEKRPGAGIWGGLWCLPSGHDLVGISERLGLALEKTAPLPAFEHRLSHVRMTIQPCLAAIAPATQVKCTQQLGWFDAARQATLGLPQPVSKLLQRLNTGELK